MVGDRNLQHSRYKDEIRYLTDWRQACIAAPRALHCATPQRMSAFRTERYPCHVEPASVIRVKMHQTFGHEQYTSLGREFPSNTTLLQMSGCRSLRFSAAKRYLGSVELGLYFAKAR